MKVLGISGSPRKGSTTDQLVQEVLNGVGCEKEFISLAGKRIGPCIACLGCVKDNVCVVNDDLRTAGEDCLGGHVHHRRVQLLLDAQRAGSLFPGAVVSVPASRSQGGGRQTGHRGGSWRRHARRPGPEHQEVLPVQSDRMRRFGSPLRGRLAASSAATARRARSGLSTTSSALERRSP